MKICLGGGTPITLASGSYLLDSLAVSADSVYWARDDGNGGKDSSVMDLTPR